MKRLFAALTALPLCVAAGAAGAQSAPAAGYDRNRNGLIDPGSEARVYALHQVNPTLKTYDTDFDGLISEEEADVLQAAMHRLTKEGDPTFLSEDAFSSASLTIQTIESRGGVSLADLQRTRPVSDTNCPNDQRWYVRRDRMDLNAFSQAVDQKDAKGASLSIVDEEVSDIQSIEARGVISYILNRACRERPADLPEGGAWLAGYTMATTLQADGLRTDDPAKDKSSLKLGVDLQWGIAGGPFATQYVTLSPYFQTDFRGHGEIMGAQLSWEPYLLTRRLNGSYRPTSSGLDYYWQLRGEADWLHVEDPGRNGLTEGADYAWVGGLVGITAFPASDMLDYRLKLYGSLRYHRDVNNGVDARLYNIGGAWNLNPDGSVSVSLEHSWGLERDKMIEVEKTILALNFRL